MNRLVAACLLVCLATPAGAFGFRLLEVDNVNVKWGPAARGIGAEVNYGFAERAQAFPGAVNCGRLAPMALLAEVWQGDPARLAAVAARAFAMWSREADVRFRRAAPGERPDILIGVQGEPERIAFANVWHGPGAAGVAPLTAATICFNPEQAWSAGEGPLAAGRLDLGTVLAHEIGHAIGLDHPGPTGALMGFANQGSIERLMPGDVAGARALYGPPRE